MPLREPAARRVATLTVSLAWLAVLDACHFDMNRPRPNVSDGSTDAAIEQDGSPCELGAFEPPTPLLEVSEEGTDDWAPFVSADGLTLLFSSYRSGGEGEQDIWIATRKARDGAFAPPVPLAELNTEHRESVPRLSSDGTTILFSSNRPGGLGGSDVWIASRAGADKPFASPENLAEVNSPESDAPWFLSRDRLRLYLTSTRDGSGWRRPFVAVRASAEAQFGEPLLIEELNDDSHQRALGLSWDELEIFVTSDRAGGTGDADIWIASRASIEEPFSQPVDLPELNTADDDGDASLTEDGTLLLLNYRTCFDGGCGGADIWQSVRRCR